MRKHVEIAAILVVALGAAGCSGTSLPAALGTASIPASTSEHAEPPVEIYTRIARGALTCWFGSQGSLRKSHVFHADVAPNAEQAGAEITIHERDDRAENPRSVRAFRIRIGSTGGGASVAPENFRFPPDVAATLASDVTRWAKGDASCSMVGVGGWAAKAALTPEPAATPPAKKKSR